MSVRALFVVQSVEDFGQSKTIKLTAATGGYDAIPEERRYHKYTPYGELKITIDNPPASAFFTPGKKVYLDFTEFDG